jgi:two-component system NarL family sensor kinase
MVTIDETVERLRGVVAEVHPAMLEHVGLEAALSVILEEKSRGRFRWSVDVRRDADGVDDRLLFSLARELIANAARHARATSVEVSIAGASGFVELTVADNGVGFSWSSDGRMPGHIGLLSVSERARAVGGEFWVESAPGGGTIAAVRMPRDAASEPAD